MRQEYEVYEWELVADPRGLTDFPSPVLVWRGMADTRAKAIRAASEATGLDRAALSCFRSGTMNYHLLPHNAVKSRELDEAELTPSPEQARMIDARGKARAWLIRR